MESGSEYMNGDWCELSTVRELARMVRSAGVRCGKGDGSITGRQEVKLALPLGN